MNNAIQIEDRVSRSRSKHEGESSAEVATGSAGLASVVRGSSRRIMIMRFRPANISLINRRHYLPRLLLTLSSKRQIQKPPHKFADIDRVTPYQLTDCRQSARNRGKICAGQVNERICPPCEGRPLSSHISCFACPLPG